MKRCIEIYTDGCSKGNPGRGGYGAILRLGNNEREISQGYRKTTNQRMELLAVIEALQTLKTNKYPIVVYSDAKYVVDTIEKKWLEKWQKQRLSKRANGDLWMRYSAIAKNLNIRFEWIRGHSGHPENERCDRLAKAAADSNNLLIDHGYESCTTEDPQSALLFRQENK